MINSPKAFRKIVLKAEEEFKSGSLNGVFLILDEIDNTLGSCAAYKASTLCRLVERIIQNRSGYLTFDATSRTKPRYLLALLIRMQRERNEIRKQDEAPQAGADSSNNSPMPPKQKDEALTMSADSSLSVRA
ncbi:hypothetical protein ACPV5J_07415 [Vibrio rotiferianus]|uniref:hypothetical protein n=1 Tax=Vibrio rotiferianus TaxID=190895 RepID=UPI00406A61B8